MLKNPFMLGCAHFYLAFDDAAGCERCRKQKQRRDVKVTLNYMTIVVGAPRGVRE